MTDLRKAAEMLMKALDDGWVERGDSVVIALRQALAQPEQEPVAWMVRDQVDGCRYPSALKNPAGSINGESQPLYTAPPKPEQEPIAFIEQLTGKPKLIGGYVVQTNCDIPLYTALPKREWVGLHLDDIPETFVGDWSFLEGAKWAEAKLKEKNT